MSHDVLGGLLRRLVAPSGGERDERRVGGTGRTATRPTDALLPDGGDSEDNDDTAHLRDLPDGAGCTEIWEHLSERQAERQPADGGAGECRADD